MGSGIAVQSQGKHVAFTAGTGVLVFMDLVAYLLIRVIEQNGGPSIIGGATQLNGGNSSLAIAKSEGAETRETREESGAAIGQADPIDIHNFSFELHTSFSSVDDGIGLEMIELLELLCHRYNMSHLFVHHSRISAQNKYAKSIEDTFRIKFEEFERSEENIQKVWVCGPPIMQEHFDRALDAVPDKKFDYHVL